MTYNIDFDKQQIQMLAQLLKVIAALPLAERPTGEVNTLDEFGDNIVDVLSDMFNDPELLLNPAPASHCFYM